VEIAGDRSIHRSADGPGKASPELISGALAAEPWRVGKPLHEPYEGLHVAGRGTYRIVYKIHEDKHRADAYRT
jgi:mRNA-degrading endonuclease RelE of RelBE toxin-antitoxin system